MFYGFGAAGLLWSTWWESVVSAMAEEDPESHHLLTETAASREAAAALPEQAMPWRAFLRNGPMRALAYTHFCNNWCAMPLLCSGTSTSPSSALCFPSQSPRCTRLCPCILYHEHQAAAGEARAALIWGTKHTHHYLPVMRPQQRKSRLTLGCHVCAGSITQ